MFADYHVHTEFSDDSVYPMEDVVRDAIDMGMEEICFTDHVDYGIKVDWDCGEEIVYRCGEPMANVDYPRYKDRKASGTVRRSDHPPHGDGVWGADAHHTQV